MIRRSKSLILALVFVASFSFVGINEYSVAKAQELNQGEVLASKSETVYVLLNHDGTVKETTVVNRIPEYSEGVVVDFGDYNNVTSLDTTYEVNKSGDKVSITPNESFDKSDSIVYEGTTDKKIPVDIQLTYYLDGKVVTGEELIGKSGTVRIEGKIANTKNVKNKITYIDADNVKREEVLDEYVPFMVQASMQCDLSKFSNVVSEDAIAVTSGNTLNLSYAMFPYPESEFAVESQVEDFELPAISFNILPKTPPVNAPDDMIEPLKEMYSGIKEMKDKLPKSDSFKSFPSQDIKKFSEGLTTIKKGATEILSKTSEMQKIISNIEIGNSELNAGIEELKNGVNGINSALLKSSEGAKALSEGISKLDGGIATVGEGMTQLEGVLQQLTANEEMIKAKLTQLMAEDPENAMFYKSLIVQTEAIKTVSGKVSELNNGIKSIKNNSSSLVTGSGELSAGLEEIVKGTGGLNTGLDSLAEGVNTLTSSINKLLDGFVKYMDGVTTFTQGVSNFTTESQKVVTALEKVSELMSNLENLDTSKLDSALTSLKDAIDTLEISKEKIKVMEENVEGYNSFMDNKLNTESKVSFIVKTKELKNSTTKTETNVEKEVKKESFINRLITLFK